MSMVAPKASNHYAALDALRGVAALSVLLFHFHEWLGQKWLAPNARFAVDFFFCLSGYVLSAAYDKKINDGWAKSSFLLTRLIRLFPIIILGTMISALYYFIRVYKFGYSLDYDVQLHALVLGLTNLPFLNAPKAIGGPQVFPLNGPQYTLFLELAVNLFWVATQRVSSLYFIAVLIAASFGLMCLFGIGGDTTETFWLGLPRVVGAFYLGVLSFRLESRTYGIDERYAWGLFVAISAATALFFYWPSTMPDISGVIWGFIVSPIIVVCGSRVSLSQRSKRVGIILGQLSYPIYALQFPIFLWINGVYQQITGYRDPITLMIILVFVVPTISWLVLRFYDEPVRKYLNKINHRHRTRGSVAGGNLTR